ncbi:hypothetical protein TanjilG_00581 [Lupinus angustifolius]|uniref:Uncharacterized protein n=1 Tax=Lupinus angustifolius TaxID=3871 RepID=A0A394D996_LUPAN|nr:hypothetical protein TanjilG_00581 [Lupinus angustifolius]
MRWFKVGVVVVHLRGSGLEGSVTPILSHKMGFQSLNPNSIFSALPQRWSRRDTVVQGGSDLVSYPHGGRCSKVVSGYISTPIEHKGTRFLIGFWQLTMAPIAQ